MLASIETEKNKLVDNDVFKLPKYCFYNKFLLVEELALEKHFFKLHQGRCTVIGKLQQRQDGCLILENISLQNLPRNYTLPEGTINLRLFKFVTWDVEVEIGQYCEVIGEVVLWNPHNSRDNWLPLTPRAALEFAQSRGEVDRQEILGALQKKYLAAVNIFRIDYIECPTELIQRHLKIRLLTTKN